MGYFISNQCINWRLDPNIHVIDEIYNIKDRSALHNLAANYTNKHVTFNNGQHIGHIEPSIDYMPQTAVNSLTTQKVIDEHVQPNTFTLHLHTFLGDVRKSLNQLLEFLNHNLHRMKQVLGPLISPKYRLTQASQNLFPRGHFPSLWSTMTG